MDDKKKDWLFRVFLTISLVWTIGVSWFLFKDQVLYNSYSPMPLNEIGDFLAGSFSPLAFFWLAYGYFMQNKELKNQLHEFKNSIEIQKNLVRISDEEIQINKQNIIDSKKEKEKEKIILHNKSQPILSINSDLTINEKTTINLIFMNDGETIRDLSFGSYKYKEIANCEDMPFFGKIDILERGKPKRFTFTFDENIFLKDPLQCFPISFLDGQFILQKSEIIFNLHDGKLNLYVRSTTKELADDIVFRKLG